MVEQLQKMGILPSAVKPAPKTPQSNGKRRSIQDDLSTFKPLDSDRLKTFSQMRDPKKSNGDNLEKPGKKREQDIDSDDDLDADDNIVNKADKANDNEGNAMLSPEEAKRQSELADGVQKIRV